jgi:hypothetical protein
MKTARQTAIAAACLLAMAAALVGCGVKSPPIPPEYARPQRIVDLRAESVKGGVKLSWGRPDTYAGGARMRNLAEFVVLRSSAGGSHQSIAEIPVTDQQRFQQQREFNYVDKTAVLGQSYTYRVVSRTSDNYTSEPSNDAEITREVPPPPPSPEKFSIPQPSPLP